jgi:hypothetical protein
VAISLVEGNVKELNSCSGVEGAVEKGSESASWMVVGAVDTERFRERGGGFYGENCEICCERPRSLDFGTLKRV